MANTRNSQKRENDDTPAAADSKDSDNADVPVTTLDTLLQELRSVKAQNEATQSELRSIRAHFESTTENHEEALLSFSTRLDRIENQLAEQNMKHDNDQNINGSNVNNSNQNVNNNNPNVNINNQNDLFNHGLLNNGGGPPARIRFRQNLDPIEDLSVSHA